MVGEALEPDHAVVPAQLDAVLELAGAIDQVLLGVILLEVDERGHLVPRLGQQIEAVDLALAVVQPADLPGHALLRHALAAAQAIEDLERALRPADRPAAGRHDVVVVEQQHVDVVQREVDRGGEPDRAGADHDHRPAPRRGALQLRRGCVGERPVLVARHGRGSRSRQPCSAAHISRSRSAVQMRG